MTIKFFEVVDVFGRYQEMPTDIQALILESIAAVDQTIPGVRGVLDSSGLRFVYDPTNLTGALDHTTRGLRASYYWPENVIYTSKPGAQRSLAHEFAHVLDVLAGPFLEETEQKFGHSFICTRALYSLYPDGGQFPNGRDTDLAFLESHFASETNFTGRFVFRGMMLSARAARDDIRSFNKAVNTFLDSSLNGNDFETQDFVNERVAHMLEEFVFICQERAGIAHPVGVPRRSYFQKPDNAPIFWGAEWLTENEAPVLRFYRELIEIILARRDSQTLAKRLQELQSQHKTPVDSLLEGLIEGLPEELKGIY